ncbi:MAG: glycosyltransferase family A protein [Synechococcales bacterium]|nr:glycosyltransferase family A protein [Synechococcales bacterium]
MPSPLISIVIPTCNRPDLLQRAIASVMAQTFTAWEILVVINGSDTVTAVTLEQIQDKRLQWLQIAEAGASHARNAGVNAANTDWIAFLDDDDEWLPEKLEKQWKLVKNNSAQYSIISSQLIARTPKGDFVRPRRFPGDRESISDYLLGRTSFFQGEGLVQTSTILTQRQLLLQVPFRQLPKHQDWDWMLRALSASDVQLKFVPEVLAIWYLEEKRRSVSSQVNWQHSLTWIRQNRALVTPQAYAAFLLVEVGSQAAQSRVRSQFIPLLKEAFQQGKPNAIVLLLYLAMWLLPIETRRSIRAKLTRRSAQSHSEPQSIPMAIVERIN